ncbi:glycosyltransferase family 2 protein [Variovorax sp. EL159]|uniref:glycosyltransferase family 2 protein n=1 Tax=Variovorax sp. EL159 TaxID=1566270 RepID=UPI00087E1F96|nr:glycosyltransferase family 2 protein [Variovorax sp. EL159]SCX72740.1 Glycosyltransferase, GT2 family [Variovorax sp. EL159]
MNASTPPPRSRLWRALAFIPNAVYKGGGLGGAARRAMQIFRQSGVRGVARSVRVLLRGDGPPLMADASRPDRFQYREWLKRHESPLTPQARQDLEAQASRWPRKPAFALTMTAADSSLQALERAVASVRGQVYPHWRLTLVVPASLSTQARAWLDSQASVDGRIDVAELQSPVGASADWLAFCDARDALAPDALWRAAEAAVRNPDVALIYTDEDRIADDGQRSAPYFKPDWNIDLLRSQDYVSRLAFFSASLVGELGGLDASFGEEAASYDLALRCAEQLAPERIVHIPKVLYHRHVASADNVHAMDPAEYAPEGGERALQAHLARSGIAATAERGAHGFRVRYALPSELPLVSLFIPTRNGLKLVRQCIESILEKTLYPRYEIILVDNGSDDPEALRYFEEIAARSGVRVLRDDSPFNYSALNNGAAAIAKGDVFGLINNDIEVISPDWLGELVSIALQPGVGAAGARLWYPEMTLQHAGVVLGYRGGVADHAHRRLGRDDPGYFGRAALMQGFSAVTAACLVVRRALYEQVGGLDEVHLKVAYNDVDFCLRLREAGYRNVWTPYAELFHHESATRPSDLSEAQIERFLGEERYMKNRWGDLLFNDPAYNPNLSLEIEDFSYAWPPRAARLPSTTTSA